MKKGVLGKTTCKLIHLVENSTRYMGLGFCLGYSVVVRSFFLLTLFFSPLGFAALEDLPPSNHCPVVTDWANLALTMVRPHFPDWIQDLDAIDADGIVGLRLHAAPIAEMGLPKTRTRWRWLLPTKQKINRPSTRHLEEVRRIAGLARVDLDYGQKINALGRWFWVDALHHFDEAFELRIQGLNSQFSDAVDAFHARKSPPSPFEVAEMKSLYLEIWTLGALWHFGRQDLIPRLFEHGFIPGDTGTLYRETADQVRDCRAAILLMSFPDYR